MVSKQSPESVFNTEDSSEYATLEPKLRPLGRRSFLKRIGFGGTDRIRIRSEGSQFVEVIARAGWLEHERAFLIYGYE